MDKYSAHKPRKQRRHHSASGPSTSNTNSMINQQRSDTNNSNYKLTRPPMTKRTSSSSSATKRAKSIRHELKRRSSSNNGVPVITSSANPRTPQLQSQTSSQSQTQTQEVMNNFTDLKHSDYMQSLERDFKPSHVMLNHLITCNSKMEGVITGSCIHRYSGKFITQIMYFPIELGDLPSTVRNEGGQSQSVGQGGGCGGGAE
ncbi:unnamed protein product [Ambrosiozyma monospora]|uniref:Unnamed protein product n=1 Tax=Ambrosiozyma monospora TaxID=43982 RepID=A0ACB5UC83_AMBMO|nr:unnamed protein product [Ambrosiozyma monospora]